MNRLDYPSPPYLEYAYPKATPLVVQNISNALLHVPKFYEQVLHLMNKMNLPPPFDIPKPHITAKDRMKATKKRDREVEKEDPAIKKPKVEERAPVEIDHNKDISHVRKPKIHLPDIIEPLAKPVSNEENVEVIMGNLPVGEDHLYETPWKTIGEKELEENRLTIDRKCHEVHIVIQF